MSISDQAALRSPGVQVQQRHLQRIQPADPHLGRGEGVHPGDHAQTVGVGVRFQHDPMDGFAVGQHGLPLHGQRELPRFIELINNLLRLTLDLLERLRTIKALASGQEPAIRHRCHGDSSIRTAINVGHRPAGNGRKASPHRIARSAKADQSGGRCVRCEQRPRTSPQP